MVLNRHYNLAFLPAVRFMSCFGLLGRHRPILNVHEVLLYPPVFVWDFVRIINRKSKFVRQTRRLARKRYSMNRSLGRFGWLRTVQKMTYHEVTHTIPGIPQFTVVFRSIKVQTCPPDSRFAIKRYTVLVRRLAVWGNFATEWSIYRQFKA